MDHSRVRPFAIYDNLILYTGKNPIVWAAFTARFSRFSGTAFELWDTEFAPFNVLPDEKREYTPAESTKIKKKEKLLDDCVSKYGDASVMETAWVAFFVQNISMLLSMLLTDPRFGWSPLERSTRRMKMYPVQSSDSLTKAWRVYNETYEKELALTKAAHPEWSLMEARDDTCDRIRHLVPLDAATLIGFTGNARAFATLYHNLTSERFTNFPEKHFIFSEIETLKRSMAAMFFAHYAPFARKLDSSHDTYVHDDARTITLTSFKSIIPFYHKSHVCTSINLLEFPSNNDSFFPDSGLIKQKNRKTDRHNRHGIVPAHFSNINITLKIYSNIAIYREFKRHRLLDCTELFIEKKKSSLLLATRAYWRATGTLEGLMRLIELRTETKAHQDFRSLCASILQRLQGVYADFDALSHVFHFTFNKGEKKKKSSNK